MVAQEASINFDPHCKICQHDDRKKIEKLILSNNSYRDICKDYPDLNPMNCSGHWRNHMRPLIGVNTTNLLENEAIQRRDSIAELTSLFDDVDEFMIYLRQNLAWDDPELMTKQLNAFKGLTQARTQMIKLNINLLGDDQMAKDTVNLQAAITAAAKRIAKSKEQATPEQATPK